VMACGICGTDQHIYHGKPGSAAVSPPIILGHEFAGRIVDVGEDVHEFRVGDRVTIDPNIYCRSCRFCQDGRPHLCENLQAIGVTRHGGMAEFCVVPVENCYRLPDSLTFEEGALIEPLGCCLHGIEQLELRPGYSAVVIGAGFIGLMMLQLLRLQGIAPVLVIEPNPDKRKVATELGAHHTIDPADDAAFQHIFPKGSDIVIECVGRADTMQNALRHSGKGGQVMLFGVADPSAVVSLAPFQVFSKELTIRGSFINPHTHPAAIALLREGHVHVQSLVSHRFSLDDVPNAMQRYSTLSVTKAVIYPSTSPPAASKD
ncbi:MAG: zinc-dependent alcohol dehydrogenase family protein, partial [Alicyclobacillus sp.]|nr:zinc-dependent alcohol dehydrogenase family protein [Alicyclobacillus sp.]